MTHRLRVRALTATLVYAFAVIVHALVHTVSSAASPGAMVPHIVELALALVAASACGYALGATASGAERRRRLAFVRADVRRSSRGYVAGALASVAAVAALLFFAEGATIDPDRAAVALISGVVALALTAFALRAARLRFVAVVGWFARGTAGAPVVLPATLGEIARPRLPQPHALRWQRYRGPPPLLALT